MESTHRRRPWISGAALLAVLAAAGPAPAAAPSYHVDILAPLPGLDSAFASDMSAEGVVAGTAGSDPFDPLGVPAVWAGGSPTPLPSPTGSLNFALGIGAPDLVAGTSSGEPYVWLRGVPVRLEAVDGMPGGVAFDASRSGVVVGAVVNDLLGRQFPAVWTSPGGPGRLLRGLRGISDGTAFAINERGRVAGIAGGAAVIWDGIRRAPRRIGTLPGGILGELVALNDLGDAAGRTSFPDGTTEAMLWLSPERRLAGLGFLDGAYSFAYGVNGARQVVGTASAGEAVHAFLWEAGVMRDLNDLVASSSGPFLHLSSAVAIDEAGRIAAEAVVPTPSGSATRAAILVPAVP